MKKIFAVLLVGFMATAQPAVAANELANIQAQIKKTEQQNKKISQQVKTSQREIDSTKKKLVRAADKVSVLEEQRSAVAKKIQELDAQRDKLESELFYLLRHTQILILKICGIMF